MQRPIAQRLRGKLIGQPGFRRLWFGQTVSEFGSQVTTLALPLAAVLVLHASTFQVGLLTTTGFAAFLLIGLPAGAWVDRVRRKPVMMRRTSPAAKAGRDNLVSTVENDSVTLPSGRRRLRRRSGQ
jgi:MFS family permease